MKLVITSSSGGDNSVESAISHTEAGTNTRGVTHVECEQTRQSVMDHVGSGKPLASDSSDRGGEGS
jgi:hypothetical protein